MKGNPISYYDRNASYRINNPDIEPDLFMRFGIHSLVGGVISIT